MWNFLRDKALWFYSSFHNNETIIWARVQMAIGAAWLAASSSDLSPIIKDPKILGYWVIANAFVTEYLRRRNADFTASDNKDTK